MNGPWMVFEYMPFGDLVTVLRNCNHQWLNLPGLPQLSPVISNLFALKIVSFLRFHYNVIRETIAGRLVIGRTTNCVRHGISGRKTICTPRLGMS